MLYRIYGSTVYYSTVFTAHCEDANMLSLGLSSLMSSFMSSLLRKVDLWWQHLSGYLCLSTANFFLLKMSICCRCHRELSWALSLQLSWALFCAKSSYCIVAAPVRLSLFVNNNLFLLKMSSLSLSSFMSSFMHSFMSSVLRKGVQWWQHLSGFLSSYWRGSQLDTSSSSNRE